MGQITQDIGKLVQQELVKQSPIKGYSGRVYVGKWEERKDVAVW
jgi:hypothetical protein